MRGRSLLSIAMMLACVAPATASAQDTAGGASAAPPPTAKSTGGSQYGTSKPKSGSIPRRYVVGTKAKRLKSGYAAAPTDAPVEVQDAIFAANEIVGRPYVYGGGHRSFKSSGYDCSGTVSYALHGAGLLASPLDSGSFMSWQRSGAGKWITVYANGGHAWMTIAGLRLDTSSAGEPVSSGSGPRWRTNVRGGDGFVLRHPAGF